MTESTASQSPAASPWPDATAAVPGDVRVLIVRMSALGDVIHGLPVATAIKRAFPRATVHWLVDRKAAAWARLSTAIDDCLVFDSSRPWRQWPDFVQRLRAESYDRIIDLQGLLKSAVWGRLAQTRTGQGFWGFHPHNLRERAAGIFYDRQAAKLDLHGLHVIEGNLQLAAHALVEKNLLLKPWQFAIRHDAEAGARIDERLSAQGWQGEPLVILNPGAGWETKRWPPTNFAWLADELAADNPARRFVITASPAEKPLAEAIQNNLKHARVLPIATGLTDLAPLFRRASLMIAGDTGPLHLAVACGTPVVALFGPTRPERNGPIAPKDIASVVREGQAREGSHVRRGAPLDLPKEAVLEACLRRLRHG